MKLSDFIKTTLKSLPKDIESVSFDLGLNPDMEVNNDSPNRVKFSLKRK